MKVNIDNYIIRVQIQFDFEQYMTNQGSNEAFEFTNHKMWERIIVPDYSKI